MTKRVKKRLTKKFKKRNKIRRTRKYKQRGGENPPELEEFIHAYNTNKIFKLDGCRNKKNSALNLSNFYMDMNRITVVFSGAQKFVLYATLYAELNEDYPKIKTNVITYYNYQKQTIEKSMVNIQQKIDNMSTTTTQEKQQLISTKDAMQRQTMEIDNKLREIQTMETPFWVQLAICKCSVKNDYIFIDTLDAGCLNKYGGHKLISNGIQHIYTLKQFPKIIKLHDATYEGSKAYVEMGIGCSDIKMCTADFKTIYDKAKEKGVIDSNLKYYIINS